MKNGNESWAALCALTDTLWQKGAGGFGDRQEAFRAACKQRPDLAAEAIAPGGERVVPRPADSKAEGGGSLLVKMAEAEAEAHRARTQPGTR